MPDMPKCPMCGEDYLEIIRRERFCDWVLYCDICKSDVAFDIKDEAIKHAAKLSGHRISAELLGQIVNVLKEAKSHHATDCGVFDQGYCDCHCKRIDELLAAIEAEGG